ncbi:MAG: hypothetical protein IAG13_34900 [Deltaproteobacteria bacterium]|nr:hypothetical protein [Nannocystaceae bacterium]
MTLVLLAAACSSPAVDGGLTLDVPLGSSDDSSEGDAPEGDTGGFDPSGPAETSTGGAQEETGVDDSDAGMPSPGAHALCPDALPEAWLFCEDFEDLTDPAATFFEYQDADGAFVLDEGDAASGVRTMKASYVEGVEGAGWLSVAFGRNPIVYGNSPQASADVDFQSIYWRVRVKMQEGWPDVGPGELTSATAFASKEWQQALVARLRSDGDAAVLLAEPFSCIVGDALACEGFDDADRQQQLGGLLGATPLFSADASGSWHCVEAHVALNTPGLADGTFEFWIDDELQNESHTLDWRGSWNEYGINLVTVENLWPGGAPTDLERWFDDLVISTEPIGCD